MRKLDRALEMGGRLVLVSAPAGFGKTTLLSEWIASRELTAAWLSLDKADNDLLRFLTYLIAALQTIEPEIGVGLLDELQSPGAGPKRTAVRMESALTALINDLANHSTSFVVVFDDYHLMEAASVHDAVSFLIDHQPPQMRLIIATRADPPLTVSRLRGQGRLVELHAADLGFAPEEAAVFLNEAMGLGLSEGEIAALESRTEGWIAGLQLAALSLQGRSDASAFIQAFAGSHRYVVDYLTEEILSRQTEEIRLFLQQTAILNRLSGPLCDAVTGGDKGQSRLERLEADNLFIVSLDEERRWYRYHHLFADLLRQRLQQEQKELERQLHQRASQWYAGQGLIPEAVDHALAAEDFEQAANLVERTAWELLTRGELATVLGWLDEVPQEVIRLRARLAFFRSWAMAHSGEIEKVEECLEGVDLSEVAGEVATIRAHVAAVRGDMDRAIALAEEANRRLPEDDHFLRGLVAQTLGLAYHWSGAPQAAVQSLMQAIALSQADSRSNLTVTAQAFLGRALMVQGKLRRAVATYREVLDRVAPQIGRPVPYASIAYVGIANALYEWNDLEGALDYATEGIQRSEASGFVPYQLVGTIISSRVHLARKDVAQAVEFCDQAAYLEQYCDYAYVCALLAELRVRLWLAQGNLQAAVAWTQAYDSTRENGINLTQEMEQITLAQVLLGEAHLSPDSKAGKGSEALDVLAPLLRAAESDRRLPSMIKILALQALAFATEGESDHALTTLQRALSLARAEAFRRTFLDEGEPMRRLLRRAQVQGIETDFVAGLLAASPQYHGLAQQALIEPLSKRELQVLHLIAAGLSNQEIARELVIAVSTVKSHINHIYGKLNVKSRTQAVARGQALGLL